MFSAVFFVGVTHGLGGSLNPLGMSASIWPIVPASDDDDECGAIFETTGTGN
jgi:hypothetical protein